MSVDEQIRTLARRLKLPAVADFHEHLGETLTGDFPELLLRLLRAEADGRQERSIARRIQHARFPFVRTIDTFVPDRLPHLTPAQIRQLATCEYIRDRHNVLAVGSPGTGKSHLAMALGVEAARQGFTVRFHKVIPLMDQLIEARDARELRQHMAPLERCDLLILDELGYKKLAPEQASMLFELFANRHELQSTYLTTNLEFSKWVNILGDPMMTAALVDRFAHKCVLLNMNGPSFRLQDGRKPEEDIHPATEPSS